MWESTAKRHESTVKKETYNGLNHFAAYACNCLFPNYVRAKKRLRTCMLHFGCRAAGLKRQFSTISAVNNWGDRHSAQVEYSPQKMRRIERLIAASRFRTAVC